MGKGHQDKYFVSEDQSRLKKIITACRHEDGSEIDFAVLYANIMSRVSQSSRKTLYHFIAQKIQSAEFNLTRNTGKINLLRLAAIFHEQENIDLGIYFFKEGVKTELKDCDLEYNDSSFYAELKKDFMVARNADSFGVMASEIVGKAVSGIQFIFNGATSFFRTPTMARGKEKQTDPKKPGTHYGTL